MNTISEKDLFSTFESIYDYSMAETKYPFDPSLSKEEKQLSREDDTDVSPPPEIVAFNELRSCRDLVKMVEKGLIYKSFFQRGYVWKPNDQARFIDSLIKGLPIPSLCISYDYDQNLRYVIDGRQRIETIFNFLTHDDYYIPKIKDIDKRLQGKRVGQLRNGTKEAKDLIDRVEDLTIPVTVIRCNFKEETHMKYLFKIFHRLNTGGIRLNNQEIRNCIYNGKFNTFIQKTTEYGNYRLLMDIDVDKEGNTEYQYRFAWEEMNLRFFAMFDGLEKYNGQLASFLNAYMYKYFTLELKERKGNIDNGTHSLGSEIILKNEIFEKTIDTLYNKILAKKSIFKVMEEKASKALIEALLVATARNLEHLTAITDDTAVKYFKLLIADKEFTTNALKEGLSATKKVQDRINKAIAIFSGKE